MGGGPSDLTAQQEGARERPTGRAPGGLAWPGVGGLRLPAARPLLSTDHRQSSHHIHHPLSTHLPPDARRRKTPQGPGRKPRRRPGASPTGETPTIEEGEEDEDEASEAEGPRALTQPSPASTPSSVQVSRRRQDFRGTSAGALAWPHLPKWVPFPVLSPRG